MYPASLVYFPTFGTSSSSILDSVQPCSRDHKLNCLDANWELHLPVTPAQRIAVAVVSKLLGWLYAQFMQCDKETTGWRGEEMQEA